MKLLIVIDMQKDFTVNKDVLGSDDAIKIIPAVVAKMKEYIERNDSIIFTMDSHGYNYLETHEGKNLPVQHCIVDTDGWQICDELMDTILNTKRPDGKDFTNYIRFGKKTFGYNKWNHYVWDKDISEIEIVGVCTDICVVSNALILRSMYPEKEITVDMSCCAGTSKEAHNAAGLIMKQNHINIIGV